MSDKKLCGVYNITCLVNDKIYIGSSKNIYKRWKEHKYHLNKNNHDNIFLQKDWNQYGEENFEFSILEECNESFRYQLEQKYLDEYRPYYRNNTGYNISENSERQNCDNIKIYRNKFRRVNPFYNVSENMKKKILSKFQKQYENGDLNCRDEKYLFMKPDDINTKSLHDWYDLEQDECIVTLNGRPRVFCKTEIDNMTRDDIEWMFWGLDTYDEIAAEQRIYGDPFDWE